MLLFVNTNSAEKVYFILTDDEGNVLNRKEYKCTFENSEDIIIFIEDFINTSNIKKDIFFNNINSIIIDKGPGINMNFRIGAVIINTIAYIKKIKIIGILKTEYNNDKDFIKIGIEKYNKKEFVELLIPEYSEKNKTPNK